MPRKPSKLKPMPGHSAKHEASEKGRYGKNDGKRKPKGRKGK